MSRIKHSYETIKGLNNFGITLLVFEIIMFLLYIRFVRYETSRSDDLLDHQRIMVLISINLMVILGVGLFMGFMQNHIISPLTFVLLIICVTYQLYILFYGFWNRIFIGFSSFSISIKVDQKLLIRTARCAMTCILGIGSACGRLAPKDIFKILPIIICGYACNQAIVELKITAFDAGGTMLVHAFGSFFALTLSFITAKKIIPNSTPIQNYKSTVLSWMGTLLLWICWPAFNYALYANNSFQRTIIVANTLYALFGSCLSTLIVAAIFKEGLSILMLHRATWAGGIVIGASAQIIYAPALSLSLGLVGGLICTLSLRYLQGRFEMKWGLLDTCGILSTSAFPSIVGGLSSSMILVGYFYSGFNQQIVKLSNNAGIFYNKPQLNHQGGLQASALFVSIGMGLFCGIISGFIVSLYYKQDPQNFYTEQWLFDTTMFQETNQQIEYIITGLQRFNVPSEERLQTKEQEQVEERRQIKKVFKTRYKF